MSTPYTDEWLAHENKLVAAHKALRSELDKQGLGKREFDAFVRAIDAGLKDARMQRHAGTIVDAG